MLRNCFDGLLAPLIFAAVAVVATEAQDRLTSPQARNGGENGMVAGGPGSVHSFGASGQEKYQHGVCGNAACTPQTYNKVGDIQAQYVAGSTAEFKIVITAHHVGYFELELCANAGNLSEACFMQHRLLKAGCTCNCPSDVTHSCSDCNKCRRWWKPLLEGELSQSVTSGYDGPILPKQGNLAPIEYTLRYVIPSNIKTRHGVIRWHYMTTNSCTSKSSAPEEFWNCADVAISDSTGDVGADLSFDNAALENLPVPNLLPAIDAGELKGLYGKCPEDPAGNLLGIGTPEEYEKCIDLSAAGGGMADCSTPPASGILCMEECGDWWFQCHNGVAYTQPVAAGTKCKGNEFVVEAECSGFGPSPVRSPNPLPAPSPSPAPVASTTPAPTPASSPSPAPVPSNAARAMGVCGALVIATQMILMLMPATV